MTKQFVVFDFDIEYTSRPNDDVYQEIVPAQFTVTADVPSNFEQLTFEQQQAWLKPAVLTELEESVLFDTPDAPEFEIKDVSFCFEDEV